jgi:hypothetical protein
MRMLATFLSVLASIGLILAPTTRLHAHADSDHPAWTIHGGHSHDFVGPQDDSDHNHDEHHDDVETETHGSAPPLAVPAAAKSVVHAQTIHAVVLAVVLDIARGDCSPIKPGDLAPPPALFTLHPAQHPLALLHSPESRIPIAALRHHLHPPLRGPPRLT